MRKLLFLFCLISFSGAIFAADDTKRLDNLLNDLGITLEELGDPKSVQELLAKKDNFPLLCAKKVRKKKVGPRGRAYSDDSDISSECFLAMVLPAVWGSSVCLLATMNYLGLL